MKELRQEGKIGQIPDYSPIMKPEFPEWEGGEFLGQQDSACLKQAAAQGLTLLTYDRRTIPPLLKTWGEEGRSHGGVIFVDEKTISPSDNGGLIRGLSSLSRKTSKWDWTNRVCFLRR